MKEAIMINCSDQISKVKRLDYIDAIRAFAMFFVVYGHQVQGWTEYFVFTSPIKMPLFFAISGYVFNYVDNSSYDFLYKTLRRLIIPWLMLSILPQIILTPFKGSGFLFSHITNILVGKEVWFMPCFIIAEIIWFFTNFYLSKFSKNIKIRLLAVVSVSFFYLGLELSHLNVLNIFMINRAFAVQIFLFIGYLLKCYEQELYNMSKKVCLVIIGFIMYLLMCFITLEVYPGQCIDVHMNRYYNAPFCLGMILLGIIVIYVFAKYYIANYPQWITLIGKHTLVIYLYHGFVIKLIKMMLVYFFIVKIEFTPFIYIFIVLLACLLCCGISSFINKFVPWVMWRKT